MTRRGVARAALPAGGDDGDVGLGFDVLAFAATAAGNQRGSLDLASFATRPLSPQGQLAVAALAVLERRTTHRLRTVLVSPTHKDAQVTAFLTTWAFEKYWIADALRAVVEAHPAAGAAHGAAAAPAVLATRALRGVRLLGERLAPVTQALVTNVVGRSVVAVHMSAAAVDDLVVAAAYRGLAAEQGHPALSAAVEQLLAIKARHQAFFAGQAEVRLASSGWVRALVRASLSRSVLPIGVGALSGPARDVLAACVQRSGADSIDARVDALPGLTGLRLVHRSARQMALTGQGSGTAAAPETGTGA